MKTLCLGFLAAAALVAPAIAADNYQYPAPTPHYPFQRSFLKRRVVIVPPYAHPFRIRVYTTPQQQPYYNVPPYPVISPY